MDSARQVIGCHVTREIRLQNAFDDVASTIYLGLMDSARHVIGCHLTREMRVQTALDDVPRIVHQSLPPAAHAPHLGERPRVAQKVEYARERPLQGM